MLLSTLLFQFSRRRPAAARKLLRRLTVQQLPGRVRRRHALQPAVRPLGPAAVPGSRRRPVPRPAPRATASVATGRIARFTETGIALESGEHLDADVIVTATGLNLLPMGGMSLSRGRRAGRRPGDRVLQGDDDLRRPQLHDGDRLHERLLDAEGGPGQPLRVPPDRPPREARLRVGHAGRPARGRRPAVPRPRVGLRPAQPGRPAEAGRRGRRGSCTRTTSATSG